MTDNLDKYELGIAVSKVYDFIWEEFCDWYIEMVKPRLYSDTDETKAAALWTLKTVLNNGLKLLHPYMPFITEEIYCTLNPEEETIVTASWPVRTEAFCFPAEAEEAERIKEAVRAVRTVRTQLNVPPAKKATVYVVSADEAISRSFEDGAVFFATLAKADRIVVQADREGIADDAVSADLPGAELYIPFDQLVDIEKEIARLNAEKERLKKEVARCEGMLKNEKFLAKAPKEKVEQEQTKLASYRQMMKQVEERLAQLS